MSTLPFVSLGSRPASALGASFRKPVAALAASAVLSLVTGPTLAHGASVPWEGVFTLFETPRVHPGHTGCAVATHLVLDTGRLSGPFATLEEGVLGLCTLFVEPNPRFYALTEVGGSCGTRIFAGASWSTEGARRDIEIVDHRARICTDVVPALLVVTETANGTSTTRFSARLP